MVWILFVNTSRKLGIHVQALGTVVNLNAQPDSRGATQVLDRGGQAVARGSYLPQVFGGGAEPVARCSVPCASQVLRRGAQAGAQTASSGDAALSQHEKGIRQLSGRAK